MLYPLDKVLIGVYSVSMKRVNYHLTEQEITALQALSKKTGLHVAELIRRAIDYWLEQKEENRSTKHKEGE